MFDIIRAICIISTICIGIFLLRVWVFLEGPVAKDFNCMRPRRKSQYRIVRDAYAGFEAQFKPKYWPFWCQCYGTNTCLTVHEARQLCKEHKLKLNTPKRPYVIEKLEL